MPLPLLLPLPLPPPLLLEEGSRGPAVWERGGMGRPPAACLLPAVHGSGAGPDLEARDAVTAGTVRGPPRKPRRAPPDRAHSGRDPSPMSCVNIAVTGPRPDRRRHGGFRVILSHDSLIRFRVIDS